MLRSHTLLHLLDLRLPTPETDISIPASQELLPLRRPSAECPPFLLSAATARASPIASSASLLLTLLASSGASRSSKQAKEHANALPTIDPSHEWRGGSREPLLGSRDAIQSHERRKLGFRSTCAPPWLALGSTAATPRGGSEGSLAEAAAPFLLHRNAPLGRIDRSHDPGPFRLPPRSPSPSPEPDWNFAADCGPSDGRAPPLELESSSWKSSMSVLRSLPRSAAPEHSAPGSAAATSTISASGWSRTEERRSMRQEEQMPVRSWDGCLPHRGGSGSGTGTFSLVSSSGCACSSSSIGSDGTLAEAGLSQAAAAQAQAQQPDSEPAGE